MLGLKLNHICKRGPRAEYNWYFGEYETKYTNNRLEFMTQPQPPKKQQNDIHIQWISCAEMHRKYRYSSSLCPLQWRHTNERYGISNHLEIDSLFNSLSRLSITNSSKLCITVPFWGNRPMDSPQKGFIILEAFPCHDVIIHVVELNKVSQSPNKLTWSDTLFPNGAVSFCFWLKLGTLILLLWLVFPENSLDLHWCNCILGEVIIRSPL